MTTISALPLLPSGIYEHYKGDEYFVQGYVSDSTNKKCICPMLDSTPPLHNHSVNNNCPKNTEGLIYVAYFSLRQIMHTEPRLVWHVREQSQFHERICAKRGCPGYGLSVGTGYNKAHEGHIRPRFAYLRPA